MAQGLIENPVINSPFVEPQQHFVTSADGQVTGEIAPRRRPSEFFVPVARPKKASGAQLTMDQFGGPQKQQPNEIVNEIRQSVERWRVQDYPHITSVTRDLLAHWRDTDRERRLFFCQIEARRTIVRQTTHRSDSRSNTPTAELESFARPDEKRPALTLVEELRAESEGRRSEQQLGFFGQYRTASAP